MKIRITKKLIKKLINNTSFCIKYNKGWHNNYSVICKNDSIIFHKHYIEHVICYVPCFFIDYDRISSINKRLCRL